MIDAIKAKTSIKKFLVGKYGENSDIGVDDVMADLQSIYRHLEEEGLIPQGLSFKRFQEEAHKAALFAQISSAFN